MTQEKRFIQKQINLNEYTDMIRKWALDRGLLTADIQPQQQMLKTVEEVGELARGVAYKDLWSTADAIGDVYVCLVVLAEQLELNIEECIWLAYNEIEKRTGTLEDGLFKKD